MAVEYMTFQEVLEELQIDEEELKRLVSNAELRGFRAGSSMKFKREDVMNLKQGRETEPTIILTDSDQEQFRNFLCCSQRTDLRYTVGEFFLAAKFPEESRQRFFNLFERQLLA